MKTYQKRDKVKFRYEYFGGIAWSTSGEIFELDQSLTSILDLLQKPRNIENQFNRISNNVNEIFAELIQHDLIQESPLPASVFRDSEIEDIKRKVKESQSLKINKPFWVHIQPFKFCNQNCIHCYCNGGDYQKKFELSLDCWFEIIDKLDSFGVIDVYVTGGENLIVDECFTLIDYILKKGMGTGCSTNATRINDKILRKLNDLGIMNIQVSLDSVNSNKYDLIRGTKGGLKRVLNGITKLSEVVEPIINATISKLNYHEIEEIVKVGITLGVKKYKFYPIKYCGRAKNLGHLLLTKNEINSLHNLCDKLMLKYGIELESMGIGEPCGSGYSGFAINEVGDCFPCIFGVENKNNFIGNINSKDLFELWFSSPKMLAFRDKYNLNPCARCELKFL